MKKMITEPFTYEVHPHFFRNANFKEFTSPTYPDNLTEFHKLAAKTLFQSDLTPEELEELHENIELKVLSRHFSRYSKTSR